MHSDTARPGGGGGSADIDSAYPRKLGVKGSLRALEG